MARKVETFLVDDISGETAAETVRFGIDGTSYEIDLSEDNAARLRGGLEDWIAVARKAGSAPKRQVKSDRADTQAVRDWARANGHEVGDRGRMPGAVVDAYRAATAA